MPTSERARRRPVLVFAPGGDDAHAIAAVLRERGFVPVVVAGIAQLAGAVADEVGAAIVAGEAFAGGAMASLEQALESQAGWFDLPFVGLAPGNAAGPLRAGSIRESMPARLSNLIVLERPLSDESLASVVAWALGIRERQFQIRDQLRELESRAAMLRDSRLAERMAAERREFIFALAEELRALHSPIDAMRAAAAALGNRLRAERVGFYRRVDGDMLEFGPVHRRGELPPLAGRLAVAELGAGMVARLEHGRNVVQGLQPEPDLADDTILPRIGVVSVIGVPLMRDARWRGGLYVHEPRPRDWTPEDVGLVEEAARLTWDAVARAESAHALAASESRMRAMVDSIDQMVWSTRPDGYHDFYNERWYAYTGVARGRIDGAAWSEVFHPDDRSHAWNAWARSLETGEPFRFEYRLRHHGGQYRWVLGRAQPARDETGSIVRWFGTCTDIQDIVDAREVLARSRLELEREVESRTHERDRIWQVSQDLLGVCGIDGRWTSVNPAWARVLGWDADQFIGRTTGWLEHADDQARTRDELAALARDGGTLAFENRLRTRGGAWRQLSWRAVKVDDEFYCVARDVTDQREQQRALRAAEEQLRQAQKMEAVGQLTGGIAHDFNNMLQGVTGSLAAARALLARGRDADIGRLLANAERAAFRAAGLTHRLLAFSRRQPLDPRPLDPNPLVASMDELLRRTLGENIVLETDLPPGLWGIRCDANQLENALLNLTINARDAMPGGGRLRIATRNIGGVPEEVGIAVSDTGAGMTPDVLERAFEPFFTTKPMGQGTGLGLSMIYGFARQSGGRCTIASEPGRGTTVEIVLPRGRAGEAAGAGAATGAEAGRPAAPAGLPVLVVEDDDIVRELVADTLRERGFDVHQAGDSAQAIALLDAGLQVELLVSDVGLPGLNGRQLAEIARGHLPRLRVLFMTGYAEAGAMPDGTLQDGMALLTKPFALETLIRRVDALTAPAAP